MNKKGFVKALAERTGYTMKEVNEVILPALEKVIKEDIVEAGGCTINGVGKIEVVEKAGKQGIAFGKEYNHTGEVKTTIVAKFPVK